MCASSPAPCPTGSDAGRHGIRCPVDRPTDHTQNDQIAKSTPSWPSGGQAYVLVEETTSGHEKADRPSRLSAAHRTVDGILVVTLHGGIGHTGKDVLCNDLIRHEAGVPPRVVADLSGVSFMDSSGINVLVFAHQHLSDAQGWLRIAALQGPVHRALTLIGVATVIACCHHPRTSPEHLRRSAPRNARQRWPSGTSGRPPLLAHPAGRAGAEVRTGWSIRMGACSGRRSGCRRWLSRRTSPVPRIEVDTTERLRRPALSSCR
ncbi:STAS domain-containing protein [Streptomyces sp. NPDC058861]|uniref:STAS domain-containing protein n=1 Tax=Streptomyces sp. NPDC058861 TaxID=3346653 RepID=UPI0036D11EF8